MSQEVLEKYYCKIGCIVVLLPQKSMAYEFQGERVIIIDNRMRIMQQLRKIILLSRR